MKMKFVFGAIIALVSFAVSAAPQSGSTSIPEFGSSQASVSKALDLATHIAVSMYSPGMVNSSNSTQTVWGYSTGTVLDVIGSLSNASLLEIDIAGTNDWVSMSAWLTSDKGSNGEIYYLFGGGSSGKLELDSSGNWRLPAQMFNFDLYLAWEIPLSGVSNVVSARIKLGDSNSGETFQDIWLRVENGVPLWLPYYAGANGYVELVFADGSTAIYSLEDASREYPITVSGLPKVKIAGLIPLAKDTNSASVVVNANGNYGDTPPLFLEEVTAPRWIEMSAKTTDGQVATGFWVRKTKDSDWTWFPANGASSVWVSLPEAGNWYIVPYWEKFGHPLFYNYWYGGGRTQVSPM